MDKKLTIEVEADTSKARRKIDELSQSAPSSGESSAAVDEASGKLALNFNDLNASVSRLNNAMFNAAQSLSGVAAETAKAKQKLDEVASRPANESAGKLNVVSTQTEQVTRNFNELNKSSTKLNDGVLNASKALAGIGVSLAMSYAAKRMPEGGARDAVEYGGSIVGGAAGGAMIGKMLGPWGAAIGALIGGGGGALNTWMDKKSQNENYLKGFNLSEKNYADGQAWAKKIKELTAAMDNAPVEDLIKTLRDKERSLKAVVIDSANSHQYTKANEAQAELNTIRSRIAQLDALSGQISNRPKQEPVVGAFRAGEGLADGISRIGGTMSMYGAGGSSSDIAIMNKQTDYLREIAENTKNGGASWQ